MKPRTLVLRTAGSNCDLETAFAFERAGATVERVHLNRALEDPSLLEASQILAIPGGFSYGDDIAAGRIFASQLRHHLRDALRKFVEAGKPIIGICNGFQVLIKTDLLPGPSADRQGQCATLAHNQGGRFVDRWIRLVPGADATRCIWTSGVGAIELPIAHGEGRFVPADENARKSLWDNGQVPLVYATPEGAPAVSAALTASGASSSSDNPNGSVDGIAGICDATGLILGLMPHPERYIDRLQHPNWAAQPDASETGDGLRFFQNAVGIFA